MLALLREKGYILTNDTAKAEIIIINTCGFIDAAKEESVQKILEMARFKDGNCRLLLAAGCLAQRYGEELLQEIPELDGIFGTNDIYGVTEAIRRGLAGERAVLTEGRFGAPDDAPRLLATPSHTAYLKIAEGCDNRCTYCAIPAIRGPYRSRNFSSVLSEAERLVQNGVKELNLIAQDVTFYGRDAGGTSELPRLLRELAFISGVEWIRLLYVYPERLSDEIIQVMVEERKICNYLDLPIQHGSDYILRRMGRKMSAQKILDLIGKLRREVPGIVLRSSFIVGFPGEGEEEFAALLAFLREAKIDRAGFFAYSREEGTAAARFRKQVAEETKRERVERAVALQSAIAGEKQAALTGKVLAAIVDGYSARDAAITLARTYGQAPEVDGYVRVEKNGLQNGQIISVRITGYDGYDLLGEITDEPAK